MTDTAPINPNIAEGGESHQGSARKNPGGRFSDSEWQEFKTAAQYPVRSDCASPNATTRGEIDQ